MRYGGTVWIIPEHGCEACGSSGPGHLSWDLFLMPVAAVSFFFNEKITRIFIPGPVLITISFLIGSHSLLNKFFNEKQFIFFMKKGNTKNICFYCRMKFLWIRSWFVKNIFSKYNFLKIFNLLIYHSFTC